LVICSKNNVAHSLVDLSDHHRSTDNRRNTGVHRHGHVRM
jgi:hypothetical protein